MMEQKIQGYCDNTSSYDINDFPEEIKKELISAAYSCLSQKTGKQKIAKDILIQSGEVIFKHNTLIYTGDSEFETRELMDPSSLSKYGVALVPIIDPDDLKSYQEEFDGTIAGFPEFKEGLGDNDVRVLGGFAALSSASSFNNLFVRGLRMKASKGTESFFSSYINSYYNKELRENYKVEVLFDRMMLRHKKMKAVAEVYHRDVMPTKLIQKTDEIYGGWINLDETPQYFSCIPGSHLGIVQKGLKEGFVTIQSRGMDSIPKAERKEHLKSIKKIIKDLNKYKKRITIPPLHMIIFPQYILHEVVANPTKHKMRRLFTGWRMSTSSKALRDYSDMMKNQAVVPLPGGMIPPTFSMNHQSFFSGVPLVKKVVNKEWEIKLINNLISLTPTRKMKKLVIQYKKKKSRKLISKMVFEYCRKEKIILGEELMGMVKDKKNQITVKTFNTIPGDNSTKTNLIHWSRKTFKPQCLAQKEYKGGLATYKVVDRHMKSLKAYGFKLYPKYTKAEKSYI